MEWHDDGIIIGARKHGETSVIATVLTREHGRHAGLIRGGAGKRMRGIVQPGNKVRATWRARLSEHLGNFNLEPIESYAAAALSNGDRLAALTSACALIDTALPEREPHPALMDGLEILLCALNDDSVWPVIYVKWEIGLLTELGFGLDLTACAATGETEDLIYVSPKSGRAVSRAAGLPYKGKLLALPQFLVDSSAPADIEDGLRLTAFFLENHVFLHRDAKMPAARERLFDRIKRMNKGDQFSEI